MSAPAAIQPHPRYHVYDMAVELDLPEKLNPYFTAATGEVIARQIHEHHMFGILLLIGKQSLCQLAVADIVAGTLECPCYGIDIRTTAPEFSDGSQAKIRTPLKLPKSK